MTRALAAALLPGALLLAGCVHAPFLRSAFPEVPVAPPRGIIYSKIAAPLDHDFAANGQGTPAGEALATGEASAHYLWIPVSSLANIAWGDGSIERAAARGRLAEVSYADYEQTTILLFYTRLKIKAHGPAKPPRGSR